MTPEEDPFIAAIAADPADEPTRLVYSDWLEEHGEDARAAYLRAEVANFRGTPIQSEWYEMPGVDQVWAHLISRWPVGILVPDLSFSESGPPITRAEIAEIEAHWGQPLPPDYAAFLLLYNGGNPSKPYLWSYLGGEDFYDEVYFFSTRDAHVDGRPKLLRPAGDLLGGHCTDPEEAKSISRMMPIGRLTYSYDDDKVTENILALILDPHKPTFGERVVEIENSSRHGLRRFEDVHAKGTFTDLLRALADGP